MLATELELPTFGLHRHVAARRLLPWGDGGARGSRRLAGGRAVWLHRARPRGRQSFLRIKEAQFPGLTLAQLFQIDDGPLHEEIVNNLINVNGDDQRRLRNLVNPALSPRAMQRYRPAMRGDNELRNLILNILVGGVDTSQSQLAHAVRVVAEHPRPVAGAARGSSRAGAGRGRRGGPL